MKQFALFVIGLLGVAPTVSAQKGVIGGTVVRDSIGTGLAEATVAISPLNHTARTNFLGEFRFENLPAGRYTVTFRRVGFGPRADTIAIVDGQVVDQEFLMTNAPVRLDSQRVVASATPIEPNMREFYDRKKMGFGHFVDEKEIRKADDHDFANFLAARFPGVSVFRPSPGTAILMSNGHGSCGKPAFQCRATGSNCQITVYMDGVPTVTNFDDIESTEFAAVEFYSTGQIPTQYNRTGNPCGVLLLWRRYHMP